MNIRRLLRPRFKIWFFKRRYVIIHFCPLRPLDFNIGFSLHDFTCHIELLTLELFVAQNTCS